ncbi:MAG: hypothetical protein Q9202_000811 [Teloschistes flavicans]
MSASGRLGAGSSTGPGKGKRRETASSSSDGPPRGGQPWQRSFPPIQSSEDSVSPSSGPHQDSPQRGSKVAIPRLRREIDGVPGAGSSHGSDSKHRVTHACEPCRQRKTKCSGERPACKHCEDFNIQCMYEDGKRDRTKKYTGRRTVSRRSLTGNRQFNMMSARVAEYEGLLQELSGRVNKDDQLLIRRTLGKYADSGNEDSSTAESSRKRAASSDLETPEPITEHQVTGRVGSVESLDRLDEDLNRSAISRATGYMGKNSEISWIEQIRRQEESGNEDGEEGDSLQMAFDSGIDDDRATNAKTDVRSSDSTYHCDSVLFMVPNYVQPYELPPRTTADALVACYLESVHPAFPILGRVTFSKQYRLFYDQANLRPGNSWMGVLNLVFALAARYSRLVQAPVQDVADDDYTYFCRARLLCLDRDAMWDHAEIQRTQVTGLTAFYLMATNQISRWAYAMSGITIRQALSLGLHMRNQEGSLSSPSKEIRYRVWWAIAMTERTLGVMTGRTTSFLQSDCSVPLPLPLEEEWVFANQDSYETAAVQQLRKMSTEDFRSTDVWASTPSSASSKAGPMLPPSSSTSKAGISGDGKSIVPNNGMFLLYSSKLSVIVDEILRQLYRRAIMSHSWAEVQGIMLKFQKKADGWRSGLPVVFDFTKSQRDQEFIRQRMCLGFSYYSTLIIINRPCLCKLDEKIPDETEQGKAIDRTRATTCVDAARSMVDLLPNEPDPVQLYRISPWWSMVHHLMQAVAILMLEMSYGVTHCPESTDDIFAAAEKVVGWLQSMSTHDMAANRAWRLSSEMFVKVAPKIGRRISERLKWPRQFEEDMSMQDLLHAPTPTTTTGSFPGIPDGQPVTPWEPPIFTSYDDYLHTVDASATHPPWPQ